MQPPRYTQAFCPNVDLYIASEYLGHVRISRSLGQGQGHRSVINTHTSTEGQFPFPELQLSAPCGEADYCIRFCLSVCVCVCVCPRNNKNV